MGTNEPDLVRVIEARYRLDCDERDWVEGLVEAIRPAIDRGAGVFALAYRLRGGQIEMDSFVDRGGPPGWVRIARAMRDSASDPANRLMFLEGAAYTSISQHLARRGAREVFANFSRLAEPTGAADMVGFRAWDASGTGVIIQAACRKVTSVSRQEARPWARIAAHLGAALRLRGALEPHRDAADAVLAPDGACVHAEAPAKGARARERLREAARRMDRARGQLRRADPAEAVEHWRALVAGRWSLLDRFESDGRRFIIARRNEPSVARHVALGERENQVVAYAGMGHPNKLIGYSLGLSVSSVATHLASAMRKLGVRSRVELIELLEHAQPGRAFAQEPRP